MDSVYTLRKITDDFKNMSDDYDFYDIISKRTVYERDSRLCCFTSGWKNIPDKYLYDLYKSNFSDTDFGQYYKKFFDKELLARIFTLNKEDTINNKKLIDLLDKDGYLTIYRGHSRASLKNSNSWTINRDIAEFFGKRNALFNKAKNYYIFTGKVKLENVIAFTEDRQESEIVVEVDNIEDITKEKFTFKVEDFK